MTNEKVHHNSSVLLIYTGGTIGMKEDEFDKTLKPFNFKQILEEVPELRKIGCRIDSYSFSPIIDSSDIEPKLWQSIVELIEKNYYSYDGFVVLHGTDTMAYTASAISFMIEGLTKPIIFTGSQLPIGVARTDGKENLISAIEIASAKSANGKAIVPEVCIYFDNHLVRGNRTSKKSADRFNAFRSENYPPLADVGINIKYNTNLILKPEDWNKTPIFHTSLDTSVAILKIHPGITPDIVRNILCGENTRAIIIETYGSGNAPSKDWFLELIEKAGKMSKIMLNVTQCPSGSVDMSIYANGKNLENCGVINGYDSTTESALAKLFYLMGQKLETNEIKHQLQQCLRGEISK